MKYGYFIGIVIFSITIHQLSFGMANKRKSQNAKTNVTKKVKIPAEVSKEAFCYWASRLKTPRPEIFHMDASGIPERSNQLEGEQLVPYKTNDATIERVLQTSNQKYVVTVKKASTGDLATSINVYDAQTHGLLKTKQVTRMVSSYDDCTYFAIQDLAITDSWIAYACNHSIIVLDMTTLGPLVTINTPGSGIRLWFNPEVKTELCAQSSFQLYGSGFDNGMKLEKYDLTALDNLENMIKAPTAKQMKLIELYKNEYYKEAESFLAFAGYRLGWLTSDHFKLLAQRAELCELVEKK